MAPPPAQRTPAWRRLSPRARRGTAGILALLAAWALAVAAANRPASLARIRASLRDALSRRVPAAVVGETLSVDPLFRVHFGPLSLGGRAGARPVLRADRVRVRAALGSLLAGRLEPASVRLYGVQVTPGERFRDLRDLLDRLRSRADGDREPSQGPPGERTPAPPRDWPAVHFRGLTVVMPHAGAELAVGPLDASLLRRRSRSDDDLEIAVSHRRGGRAWAQLHRGADGMRLRASAQEISPSVLPSRSAAAAVAWSGGTLTADLSLQAARGAAGAGTVRLRLSQAWLSGARLGPEPVGPISVDLDGAVELDPAEGRAALRDGVLRLLGAAEAHLDAEARLGPGLPFSATIVAPDVDFGALVDALPGPLRPPPSAPAPRGPISLRLALAGPLRAPSAWTVDAGLDLAHLRDLARKAPPSPLREPFTWQPEPEGDAVPPAIRIGPENPAFVPIDELPDYVVRAVTTSEDAGFFAHSGFDFDELRAAFAQGAEAGRLLRGASTITQQLAKNLFLSRERTLLRKAREALVAIGLEATVPKARLLEIYLNLAEWGPGLWGIGPAAEHYFGKPARELTLREAAFLASIIPNPVRYHSYFARGTLDEAWNDRLRVILLHMAEAGVVTDDQLEAALDAPLDFASRTAALQEGTPEAAPPSTADPIPAD